MLWNINDSMRLLDKNTITTEHLQLTNNSTRGHNQKILNFIVSIIAQSCCCSWMLQQGNITAIAAVHFKTSTHYCRLDQSNKSVIKTCVALTAKATSFIIMNNSNFCFNNINHNFY